MADQLLQLKEATKRLRPHRRRYLGVQPIEVGSIIGTDSRDGDFDREFRALRPELRERLRRVGEAFPDGGLPPITVEKLGDAYFVIDGHHRVALARQRGALAIDADVTELTARWHLSANADRSELVHAEQERLFMTESGLADVTPDVRIRFTRPVGYRQLLEAVKVHGYQLMLEAPHRLGRGQIALDWYSHVYLPAADALDGETLAGACPEATISDRFLWLVEQGRERSVEQGPRQVPELVRLIQEHAPARERARKLSRPSLRRRET